MLKNLSLLILVSALYACSAEEDLPVENLPPELSSLENLTIHSLESETDTVLLIKDQTFGDTEDVFYGSMSEFTVDDDGRVYVADSGWGSRSLHVYNPDGSYLMKLAGEGKGPAEFLSLSNLHFSSNKIMFYDSDLKRINLFNVNPLELYETILVDNKSIGEGENSVMKNPTEFNLESDGNFLVGFQETPRVDNAGNRLKSYYRLDSEFNIVSENLINLKAKEFIHSNQQNSAGNVQFRIMQDFPFFERNFLIPSQEGGFYTVESRHFLIKKYDQDGNYLSGFYHPFLSPKVTREDAFNSVNKMAEDLAENVELPDFWPVINSISVDDENRFWVSTNTENEDFFEWWVLEESGEVKAKFRLPANRYQQPGGHDKIIVKNGFLYKRDADPVEYTTNIIRYKIEFTER